ncbi:MAG: hypothetical protein QNJ85_04850 [Gammaproteobacteria bacterium]|nr:hypothetical protein [Gammaproteobacteria bacterium]
MSSDALGLLKIIGGFGLVMAFCLYQINSLKRDRLEDERRRERELQTARAALLDKRDKPVVNSRAD